MTEQHRPTTDDHGEPGTGLAPGDLDDVLVDDPAPSPDAGETADDGPQDADGRTGADPDGRTAMDEGEGGDRQRLADFARGFGGSAGTPGASGGTADDATVAGPATPQDGATADTSSDEAPDAPGGTSAAGGDGRGAGADAGAPRDARGSDADADAARPRSPVSTASAGDGPGAASTGPEAAPAGSATEDGETSAGDRSTASSDGASTGDGDASPSAGRPTTSSDRPSLNPGEVYRIVDGKEHRDTAWSRLVARTKELFTGSPAQEEDRLDHDLEELRLRGLSKGVTLALGSIKGGAGKTTITLTLAEVLANALRVGVLVVDADLEFGTASDSVPDAARHGGTLMDVHRRRDEIVTPGDLAPYLVTLPHGAQLLSGPTDPADIERIDTDTMTELMELLRRFYPIILVDLPPGMGLRGSIPRWGFAEADDIVLVTTPKRANVKQMGHMLDYVSDRHEDVPLTLAINMVPSRLDEAGQRVVGVAQSNGRSRRTAEIPEDPALSRQLDAGALDIAGLDQRTRIAVKDLTYALASQWCR